MNKKYILAEIPDRRYHAGEKARNDVIDILKNNDFEHIVFFHKGRHKIVVFIQMFCAMIQLLIKLKPSDIVLIQYPYAPVRAYCMIFTLFFKVIAVKKAKSIALIHDLNYLRNIEGNDSHDNQEYSQFNKELESHNNQEYSQFNKELEIGFLKRFDCIICHNEIMLKRLKNDGIESQKIVSLDLFDYLSKYVEKDIAFDQENITITVAGNLDITKAGYLSKIGNINYTALNFYLYGPNYTHNGNDKGMKYMGIAKPEELPLILNSNFGLVWDGNSLDGCDGYLGRYLKYNNPHKASLYIACGLPLIVWKQSAISKFVTDHGIGVCIDNLYELERIVHEINKKEYDEMLENVESIRKKVINGHFLTNTVNKAIENIK